MPEENEDLEVSGRTFWSGTITFGLVSVPVALLPANRSNRTSLRMLSPEGNPLTRRYFSTVDDKPLDWGDIIRGYEIEKDEYVIVEDEELEKLAPERTRDIDLRVFVPASDIDPMYFERAYYLTPAGGSTKAYRLLAKVMEDTDRAGIATFVMRGKEYLVAILAENGILRAETLRFADEIRSAEDVGLPPPEKPTLAEIRTFTKEIEKLQKPKLDPEDLEETSADRLHALVKRKLKAGEDVVHIEPEEEDGGGGKDVLDLVEMLQRSLRGQGSGLEGQKPGGGKGGDGERKSAARHPERGEGSAHGAGGGKKPNASAAASDGNVNRKKAKLETQSKAELYERAQELDIPRRSSMTKDELIEAIGASSPR